MTIYYQHIGEKLWARDAPKSIGTPVVGLKQFSLSDLFEGSMLSGLSEAEEIQSKLANRTFQIWGFPSGAAKILQNVLEGDLILLLESTCFRYIGKIVHCFSDLKWDLSREIWGEEKFPVMIMITGSLIMYDWIKFSSDFNFDQNYHMRGNTMKISDERFSNSRFNSEENFYRYIHENFCDAPTLEQGMC